MSDPQVALMMLAVLVIIIFLGFPIAFTLMALGIIFGYYAYFDGHRMWRAYERAMENGVDTWSQVDLWWPAGTVCGSRCSPSASGRSSSAGPTRPAQIGRATVLTP